MAGPVGTALAERDVQRDEQLSLVAKIDRNKDEVAKALPRHVDVDRFLRAVKTALVREPRLGQCEHNSIMLGVMDAARLGLEIADVRGQAYLIPRWDNKDKCLKAVFQTGVLGDIDIAGRVGILVRPSEIHENDQYDIEEGTGGRIFHKPTMRDRGPVVAYYAVATMADGRKEFAWMSVAEAEEFRDKFASQRTKEGVIFGPWHDHFDAMARKTVVRRVLRHLPQSIELRTVAAIEAESYEADPPTLATHHPSSSPALPAGTPLPPDVDGDTGEIDRTTSPQADNPDVVDATTADDKPTERPPIGAGEPPMDRGLTPWQEIGRRAKAHGVEGDKQLKEMCSQILGRTVQHAVKGADVYTVTKALDALAPGSPFPWAQDVGDRSGGSPPAGASTVEPAAQSAVAPDPQQRPDPSKWTPNEWSKFATDRGLTVAALSTKARSIASELSLDWLGMSGVPGSAVAEPLLDWVLEQAEAK